MKKAIWGWKRMTALALGAGLLLSGCSGSGTGTATDSGEPMIKVNDTTITREAYNKQFQLYANLMALQSGLPESIAQVLIQDAVIDEDMKKNEVEVKKEDVDALYDQMLTNMGGKEAYEALLKQINVTDEAYRTMIQREAARRAHLAWYSEKYAPTEEEMNAYFESNKDNLTMIDVDHILVATEEEAKAVKARLDAGEDFASVAKEVSTDPVSAAKGGALGEVSPSTFVKEFSEAAMALKEGEISNPVKTQFGYHIIRLNALKDTKDELQDTIKERLANQKYQTYLAELQSNAKVERLDQPSSADENSVEIEESSAQDASNAPSESSAPAESGASSASN